MTFIIFYDYIFLLLDNLQEHNVNPYPVNTNKWLAFATSIEPGLPAHLCSLTRLCTVGWPTLSFLLDIHKMIMDSAKNGRWIILFKKFGMIRVKTLRYGQAVPNTSLWTRSTCRHKSFTFDRWPVGLQWDMKVFCLK